MAFGNSVVITVILALGLASQADAATLEVLRGRVLVNSGHGFKVAGTYSELRVGDKIIADPGSAAVVVYPNGCSVPVIMGSVVEVAGRSPCPELVTGSINRGGEKNPGGFEDVRELPPARAAGP